MKLLLLLLPSLAFAQADGACADPAATADFRAAFAAMQDKAAGLADRHFDACLSREPTCVPCAYESGWAHWLLGRYDEAAAAWQRTLDLQPGHADAAKWAMKAAGKAKGQPGPPPYRPADPDADVESTPATMETVELAFEAPGASGLVSCKAELASASRPDRTKGPRNKVRTPKADVDAMPRVAAGAAASQPGANPAALPVQPLTGPPAVLARIGAVMRSLGEGRTRISVWGASHTSADRFTGRLRRVLQGRGGDGGHGFVLPAELYKWHGGRDVSLCRTVGWAPDWADVTDPDDPDRLGFGGMSVTSADPADFGWVQTTAKGTGSRVARVDVYAHQAPGAGTLLVSVDGGPAQEVALATPTRDRMVRLSIALPDGAHRVRLAPKGDGPVTLFGTSMERERGVIVDALGIRGREARTWLMWEPSMLRDGLEQLKPDLVVLAYGTNEAADPSYSMAEYRRDLVSVLERLRQGVPYDVPCVLAGPSDRFAKRDDGDYAIWARTADVAKVQAEVAPLFGCAAWDWQAATGGSGSALGGLLADPPLTAKDGIHHTPAGYSAVADRFLQALDATK
jgi:lysophospholipase L1-like esterase